MFKDLGLFQFLKERVLELRVDFDRRQEEVLNSAIMRAALDVKTDEEVIAYFNAMRNGIMELLEGTGILEEIRKEDAERRAAAFEEAGERRMGA